MIDTAQSLVGSLTDLAVGTAVVIAVGMILWAWLVKRTVSAVIGVIILAGIVLFAITSTGWLRDRVADDVGAAESHIRVGELWVDDVRPDRQPGRVDSV